MNQQATPVIRSAAPGNANHGVARPAPRAVRMLRISATALANTTTNAFQPAPTQLIDPPAAVRRCHATMPTLPLTLTASRGLLKSP
jgi:hypothetical protein